MESSVLGYYGKMPVSPEFLRRHAGGSDIQDLDQWFQQGIHQAKCRLGATWSREYEGAGCWNFLYVPESGSRFFTGLVMPGKDVAGREFPFFHFLRVERDAFKGPPWLAPLELEPVFCELQNVIGRAAADKDLAGFHAHMDALSTPLLDAGSAETSYLRHTQQQKMGEFWTAVLGDFSNPAKYYLDCWLGECLKSLSFDQTRGLAWGLVFPLLPAARQQTHDVPFWLDLASRHLGYPRPPTFVLWNRRPSRGRPRMMACYGKGPANPMLFMVLSDQEDRTWFDLASDAKAEASATREYGSASRRAILDDPDQSLDSFLTKTIPTKV
jgi:type VI secretion system protein ImpM